VSVCGVGPERDQEYRQGAPEPGPTLTGNSVSLRTIQLKSQKKSYGTPKVASIDKKNLSRFSRRHETGVQLPFLFTRNKISRQSNQQL
jgi:hypothetical protein